MAWPAINDSRSWPECNQLSYYSCDKLLPVVWLQYNWCTILRKNVEKKTSNIFGFFANKRTCPRITSEVIFGVRDPFVLVISSRSHVDEVNLTIKCHKLCVELNTYFKLINVHTCNRLINSSAMSGRMRAGVNNLRRFVQILHEFTNFCTSIRGTQLYWLAIYIECWVRIHHLTLTCKTNKLTAL